MEQRFGNRFIGDGQPVLLVAEISANHGHSLENALKTVKAAAEAGADAIKLQTYTADTITIQCDRPEFRINAGTIWDGKTLYDLYKEAYTPWEWHKSLFQEAKKLGLICFSTPFDPTSVDFLEELNVPAYKIASFEITDIPLIRKIAALGKPVLISTGIATDEDIKLAVDTCRLAGNQQVVLLQCTSSYPAKPEDANLLTMADMKSRFGTLTGLSDHSMSHNVPVAATALGACIIEKHFILERSSGGPDASFSLEPQEFSEMVNAVRETSAALGQVDYSLNANKKGSRVFSRSLFAIEDIKEGEAITINNVKSIRPGHGLHPKYLDEILGRRAAKNIEKGTPLCFDKLL